jgi:hypothetical protein
MRRKATIPVIAATLLLGSCLDSHEEGPPELRLPMFFALNGTAHAETEELTADCALEFVVEISGEVSRTDLVVEYIARMGGDAMRNLERPDGSGVNLRAFAFYPNLQVLHILPNRVQLVSLDFPPDGPTTGSRFWDELRFFDGILDEDGRIEGEWLCAPLDVEQGGINDDTIFADGRWDTVELQQ